MSKQSLRTNHIAALLFALLWATTASAGTKDVLRDTWPGPDVDLIAAVLAAPAAALPEQFPPSHPAKLEPLAETDVGLLLAKALGRDDADREQLRIMFGMVPGAIREQLGTSGRDNDLAALLSAFVAASVQASNGGELVGDGPADALYAGLAAAIAGSDDWAALNNSDKVRMHDWLACMVVFLMAGYDEARKANDESRLRELAQIARDAMRIALDTDVTTLAFDGNTLVRKDAKRR